MVAEALVRLRQGADRLASACPEMEWVGPPRVKPVVLASGEFRDLTMEPGSVVELRSRLQMRPWQVAIALVEHA